LQKLLKTMGYGEENHKKVIEILTKNKQKGYGKHAIFKQKTSDYLAILEAKKPKEIAKIHCSSDSIESASECRTIGKLKQKINRSAKPS
jgi:hypothetical protein